MEIHQDREIAQGLRKGEAGAFRALFEAYFERVWRSVARLVGPNSADVADVVQETFVAAAKQAPTYDPARGSLWLWLGGIARNHAGTFHRNRHRRNRLAAGGDLHIAVGKHLAQWFDNRSQDPPDQLMSTETAALVRAVLAELPSDYQSLLIARHCDGATSEQIAQVQGCSAGAIRSRLVRARQAFRQAFAKYSTRSCSSNSGRAGAHHEP